MNYVETAVSGGLTFVLRIPANVIDDSVSEVPGRIVNPTRAGRSWRELGDFVVRHREALLAQSRPPKDRLPSYSTLRRVLLRVDFDALSTAFLAWARTHVEIAPGEWLSIDGKSLAGTITNPHDAQQNFTALVTLYAQRRGPWCARATASRARRAARRMGRRPCWRCWAATHSGEPG